MLKSQNPSLFATKLMVSSTSGNFPYLLCHLPSLLRSGTSSPFSGRVSRVLRFVPSSACAVTLMQSWVLSSHLASPSPVTKSLMTPSFISTIFAEIVVPGFGLGFTFIDFGLYTMFFSPSRFPFGRCECESLDVLLEFSALSCKPLHEFKH